MTTATAKIDEQTVKHLEAFTRELPEHLDSVRVVGRWIWIEFDTKPDENTRQTLKKLGYRWNPKRSAWQNSCGFKTRAARGYDPRDKYGQIRIRRDSED